ncbi:MAG: peptidoglycan -binding protein [Xanthomonadales bacterium]|nr:peptidoglycan -binding protein [Xanthomonadales bacterium]
MSAYASRRRPVDIWPGFVDALAALLMVVIFVLMIFTLGQFFLTDALSGRDRALAQLNAQVAELAEMLSMEQAAAERLRGQVSSLEASLTESETERARLGESLSTARSRLAEQEARLDAQTERIVGLERDIALLEEIKADLEKDVAALAADLDSSRREAQIQSELSEEAQAQVVVLNRQLAALREQLATISEALEVAEAAITEKDARIADLGRRLNLALASKVQQLAEYRSDFFGRLKEVLGDNPDLRIVGDRFVFQSELLFATGSASLEDEGRAQVRRLANTLREISLEIPDDIDWVLRVDGHTDKRPINTPQFPSNWELSTARALAIVKYLIDLGIPADRLAATGFGEYQPLDDRENELAYARNRRIELKLTAR